MKKTPKIAFALVCLIFASMGTVAAQASLLLPDATLETQSDILNHIKVRYWGNYSGPQVASPVSQYTTDPFGSTAKRLQNFDDLLTMGYQVTPGFRPGIGMPFNLLPTTSGFIQIKPIYVGIIDAKILEVGALSIHTDFRIYTPIGDVAATQDVISGFRTSQITLYKVPNSNWTLGCYTYIRGWLYGKNGKGFRNDWEVYLSPFVNYKLTKTLSANVWSDLLQLGHQFGAAGGLQNLPVDIQPGIKWDITPDLNVTPYLNFIPSSLGWDKINMGLVINAALI